MVVFETKKRLLTSIHPLVGTGDFKPVARSGLRHGFTLSTTTYSNQGRRFPLAGGTYQRCEVCGLWQEDHLKINDGKVKETASWCYWRKPHRHILWGYRLAG